MDCRKVMLAIFAAMLGASFMHQASAQWGTGGAVQPIKRKSHLANLDLHCDITRTTFVSPHIPPASQVIPPAQQMKVNTLPSALNPTASPQLTFSGEMFCAEVEIGDAGLENAVTRDGVTLVGRFKLTQQSPAQRPTSTLTQPETGLIFSQVGNVRTWTFVVPAGPAPGAPTEQFPFPELLYFLEPADEVTFFRFCGHPGEPLGEFPADNCRALLGLQLPANQADYPARNIDGLGGNDLQLGEVFKFTTTTTNGTEAPGKFFWSPCNGRDFSTPKTFVVDALANASHDGGEGKATGISLTFGQRLAVTVNQNDLWNSGAQPRWSNADGQIRQMIAKGHDDSQTQAGVDPGEVMGTNWPTKLASDGSHMLHRWNGSAWVVATEAAFGTLVGSTDGTNFYIFGTAFDGPAPAAGPLSLYYWDTPRGDNTEFATVTVATDAIQCTVVEDNNVVPLWAAGNAYGVRKVEVETFATLNVDNKSASAAFPIAILGCNQGDAQIAFGPKGSPIVVGNSVLVNDQPVAIKSFSVGNKVSRPSCDGGQALADLQLQLNRLDFIKAVAPNGACQNGPNTYRIRVGQGTFYGGEDTVNLIHCN
jgi:hypothetical protein